MTRQTHILSGPTTLQVNEDRPLPGRRFSAVLPGLKAKELTEKQTPIQQRLSKTFLATVFDLFEAAPDRLPTPDRSKGRAGSQPPHSRPENPPRVRRTACPQFVAMQVSGLPRVARHDPFLRGRTGRYGTLR